MEQRLIEIGDAEALSKFYLRNTDHLLPWEPKKESDFHSLSSWSRRVRDRAAEFESGASAHFLSYDTSTDEIVATCSITNIARGPFQAGNIGYTVCKGSEGKGYMKQLCQYVIQFAFEELGLHRVMANYMPCNQRSEALLNQLGFQREGLARKYLCINGEWEVGGSRVNFFGQSKQHVTRKSSRTAYGGHCLVREGSLSTIVVMSANGKNIKVVVVKFVY